LRRGQFLADATLPQMHDWGRYWNDRVERAGRSGGGLWQIRSSWSEAMRVPRGGGNGAALKSWLSYQVGCGAGVPKLTGALAALMLEPLTISAVRSRAAVRTALGQTEKSRAVTCRSVNRQKADMLGTIGAHVLRRHQAGIVAKPLSRCFDRGFDLPRKLGVSFMKTSCDSGIAVSKETRLHSCKSIDWVKTSRWHSRLVTFL
jgi:hypothetical protein